MEATTEVASMAPATMEHLGVARKIMAMTSTMSTMTSISRMRWGTWSASMSGCRQSTRMLGMEVMTTEEASTSPGAGAGTTSEVEGAFGAAEAEVC